MPPNTTRPFVLLHAAHASQTAAGLIMHLLHSPHLAGYRFVLISSDLSIEGTDAEKLDSDRLPHWLASQHGAIIQTFAEQDHLACARLLRHNRNGHYLLATHCEDRGIALNRRNHVCYNKRTDLNIFASEAAYAQSGHPGWLGLHNPVRLAQPQLGEDAAEKMHQHVYDALLRPDRIGIDGRERHDDSEIRLSYITHFYCNQQDIRSVTRLLERYAAYPEDIRARVHFVIVDDGSPIEYDIPDLPLNLTWLKIAQDIRWNQAGARNMGAVYARSDTILMTDLDHEVPAASMRALIRRGSCGKRLYKIRRRDEQTGKLYNGHPNMFLLSRGRYFECHGYDEEFAGHYGAEDFRFVKYMKASGTLQTYLPRSIFCIERSDINRSKSYHSLTRDLSFNTPVDCRKKRELATQGHGYGHSRQFLNFTWTTLLDKRIPCTEPRKRDTFWKMRYLLRQILPRF